MITIDGFELENTQELNVTKDYVRQRLRDFNEKYFDSKLDVDCFGIKLFPYKNMGGAIYFNTGFNRFTGQTYNTYIKEFRLSTYFSFTEVQLCNVILHEMIHLYQLQILKRQDLNGSKLAPHGRSFTSKMYEINRYGWNIHTEMLAGDDNGISQKGKEKEYSKYVDSEKESIVYVVYRGCVHNGIDFEKKGEALNIRLSYKDWLLHKEDINNYMLRFYPDYFLVLKIVKNSLVKKKDLFDINNPKNRKIFIGNIAQIDNAIARGDIINMDEYKEIDLDESLNKTNDFIKGLQEDPYTEIDVREDGDIISISGIIS